MTYAAEPRKREKIDETELERIARDFIRTSLGGPDSEISAARLRNLEAYNAKPEGEFAPPDILDRSQYVATDVADTVDGMLPQLLDVFVSDDKAVECEATKPDQPNDEYPPSKQAADATGYLNHLFYVRNEGLNVLHDWIQDAALQKVGWAMVWAEERSEDSKQTYEGLTEDQVAMLLQDGAQIEGEPQADETGITVTVVNESKRMHYKAAAVPPHEMRVTANAKWGEDPVGIGRVCNKPRFELEEMGFDLEGIGGDGDMYNVEADAALGDGRAETEEPLHDSHRLYEYGELYLQLDADGDGIAEWVQLCTVNGQLMKHEQTDDHPFSEICLMPRAHAYFGGCPADRAYAIQKDQTNLTRALVDNVLLGVNQRTYVNTKSGINIADLLDNRPGGIVRGTDEPGKAFAQMPTQAIPQTAWQLQEFLSVKLENRTGFTRYSQGMDAKSLNDTAHGIDIITSKSDMRLRLMTRFAAQGIRKMFAKLLKLAVKHQQQKDWFQVNGQFVGVNPSEWRDQFNIKINVGLGHGTKQQQAQRVMAMLPLQQFGMQVGVVDPSQIANTIRTFAQVNEFKNPDQFAHAQPHGMPNPQQWAQAQEQMAEMAKENAQLKQENASKQGDLMLKAKELELKEAQFQDQQQRTEVELTHQHMDRQRAGQESAIKGRQAEHAMSQDNDLSAKVSDMAQQLDAVTKFIQSMFQQPQE